jgi:hypothetical protein
MALFQVFCGVFNFFSFFFFFFFYLILVKGFILEAVVMVALVDPQQLVMLEFHMELPVLGDSSLYPEVKVAIHIMVVRQNKTNQTKPNQTKQNKTKPNKTKQNKTKQNKTKQNKTKQNKTKQNKTKQNKN